jgi:copper chaperone
MQTLTVIGMRCNHCRNNVIRAISTLPRTENVDADLASGLVTVTGSTPTEEIIRTIESLGFEVKKEG